MQSDRRKVGKGSEVNRDEGLGSVLRVKLEQAGLQGEGLLKEHTDAGCFAGADMGKTRLDLTLQRL